MGRLNAFAVKKEFPPEIANLTYRNVGIGGEPFCALPEIRRFWIFHSSIDESVCFIHEAKKGLGRQPNVKVKVMLFLLIGLLLIAAGFTMLTKRNRESLYLLGMCCSLMVQFSGILIFIAKKGGYSRNIISFLFFSQTLRIKLQYLFITLDTLGYIIAIGRYLFPLFLLESALQYSMIGWLRRHPDVQKWICLLPAATLAVYFPPVFRFIVGQSPIMHNVLVEGSYWWIIAYVAIAIFLLVQELFAITMRFCRKQFIGIVVCHVALSGLYLLYCGQDPAQVYQFYSYDYIWNKGIGYLQYAPTMAGYVTIVVVNIICGALGTVSLMHYTQDSLLSDQEEMALERKFDIARTGASVFVHSIKNQLLANRILEKRIYQELDKEEPDLVRIRACVEQLHQSNEMLIARSEELYRTVKNKSMTLVPTTLGQIKETTLERFYHKYPDARLKTEVDENVTVLADQNYLSEALYNLLTNAWEANVAAGHGDRAVELVSHKERLYTVLEVRDDGCGMTKAEQKKIFEPFYSSKNSNTSWGMGLYHVRTIIRAHVGSLRVESRPGRGTSFFVLLPKYVQDR